MYKFVIFRIFIPSADNPVLAGISKRVNPGLGLRIFLPRILSLGFSSGGSFRLTGQTFIFVIKSDKRVVITICPGGIMLCCIQKAGSIFLIVRLVCNDA